MGERFFDMKGLDWPALMARYESIITRTRTDTEFNRIFNNLLGELEGSHMGMSGGRNTGGEGQSLGYLGIDVKPVPGGYQVTRIVPNGPSDRPRSADRSASAPATSLPPSTPSPWRPMRTPLPPWTSWPRCRAPPDRRRCWNSRVPNGNARAKPRLVLVTPPSSGADTVLRYRDEVRAQQAIVDKLSGGKLGYLHIRAMDMASVRDYERDLFAAADGKLGLIIDVRDNGGGSTNDILLSSLTAPRHAYTACRGVDVKTLPRTPTPATAASSTPTTARSLCSAISTPTPTPRSSRTPSRPSARQARGHPDLRRGSLYRALRLIDGSSMRTPFRAWYTPDGKDMENNGAAPDIVVPQTPESEVAGQDPQLEAAVKELLTRAKEP
jgi:tricorn protease